MLLSELKLNENNPRTISEVKLEALKKSITEFEKMLSLRPIVVDETGTALGGNMRLRALMALGYKEIPDEWVKRADDLTDEEKRQFIIKDNVGFGEWDWDTLANEWDAEELAEWGLDVPDIWGQEVEAKEDYFEVPDVIETDIVPGDLIEIGRHRLLCGDSTSIDDIDKLVNSQKISMVFTDPPFDMDINLIRPMVLYAPDVMQVWITNDTQAADLILSHRNIFYTTFILHTGNSLLKNNRQPITTHCMMPVFNFHEAYEDLNQFCTIIDAGRDLYMAGKGMSHAKSIKTYEAVFKYFLRDYEIICDWFMHSGSSMVAAHQLGRTCYGMEIDQKYCQVIIDRMLKLDPAIEVKINGKAYGKRKEAATDAD